MEVIGAFVIELQWTRIFSFLEIAAIEVLSYNHEFVAIEHAH